MHFSTVAQNSSPVFIRFHNPHELEAAQLLLDRDEENIEQSEQSAELN